MKTKYLAAVSALLLAGCVYSETPYGRYAAIDLPVESRTTINKTVTINAPPGTRWAGTPRRPAPPLARRRERVGCVEAPVRGRAL